MRGHRKGFTLVEVMVAGLMMGVFLTACTQFFLTQLNQYYLITGNNKLCEQLRTFAKFMEKDIHNSIEFRVFDTFASAVNYTYTKVNINKNSNSTTDEAKLFPKMGNCLLLIQERGMGSGGRGVIYYVGSLQHGPTELVNGTQRGNYDHAYYPLYRALVTFNNNKMVQTTEASLDRLIVADLKPDSANLTTWTKTFTNGIFYMTERRRVGDKKVTDITYPHLAGCRYGLFVGTTLRQPGLKSQAAETPCNFCFYSRNPRF